MKGSPRALRILVKYTVPAPANQKHTRRERSKRGWAGPARFANRRTLVTFDAEADVDIPLQHFHLHTRGGGRSDQRYPFSFFSTRLPKHRPHFPRHTTKRKKKKEKKKRGKGGGTKRGEN